jgi:hypothetical protein
LLLEAMIVALGGGMLVVAVSNDVLGLANGWGEDLWVAGFFFFLVFLVDFGLAAAATLCAFDLV